MKRISIRRTVLSVLALFAFAATLIVSSQIARTTSNQVSGSASNHPLLLAADESKGGTGR